MHARGTLAGPAPDVKPVVEYALLVLQRGGGSWDGKPLSMTSAGDWRKQSSGGLPEALKDVIYHRYISLLSASLPEVLLYRVASTLLDMLGAFEKPAEGEKKLPREALAVRNAAFLELAPVRQAILQAVSEKYIPRKVLALCHFPPSYFEGNWQLICDAIEESSPSKSETQQVRLRELQAVTLQHGANLEIASFASKVEPDKVKKLTDETLGSVVKLTSAWTRRQCNHLQGEALHSTLKQLYAAIDDNQDEIRHFAQPREIRLAFQETVLDAIPSAVGAVLPAPDDFTFETVENAIEAMKNRRDPSKCVALEEIIVQVKVLRALGRFSETSLTKELAQLFVEGTEGAMEIGDLTLTLAITKLLSILDPKQQRAGQVTPVYNFILFHGTRRRGGEAFECLPEDAFYAQLEEEYKRSLVHLELDKYEEQLAWAMQTLPISMGKDRSLSFASFRTLAVLLNDGPSSEWPISSGRFELTPLCRFRRHIPKIPSSHACILHVDAQNL